MDQRNSTRSWFHLALLWLVLVINMGFTVYGSGVINSQMADSMTLDRATLGGAFAIFQWTSGLPGPLVALLVTRYGARFTLTAGSLLLFIGSSTLAALVSQPWQFTLVFGVVIGLAAVVGGPLAAQAIVARWFSVHRARAMALLLTAPAIGGFLAPQLFTAVIGAADGNWRAGWWAVAIGGLASAAIAWLLVRNEPGNAADEGAELAHFTPLNHGPSPADGQSAYAEIVASRSFWLMLLSLAGVFSGFMMFAAHGVIHLRDLGYSAEQSSSSFSLIFLALFASNLVFAMVGDRLDLRALLAAASIMMAAGLLCALDPATRGGLYLYPVLLGGGFGLAFSASMVLPTMYFSQRAYVHVIGVLLALSTTYGALGSLGAGVVFDRNGSYQMAFNCAAGLALVGAVIALFLGAKRQQA